MIKPTLNKTYRVVGVLSDGKREVIHGRLMKDVADAIKATLFGVFPIVLIEDDPLPVAAPNAGEVDRYRPA